MKVVILTEEQAALIAEFITGPGKFCASQPCTPSDEPINGEPCIYKQNKLLPLLTPVEIPDDVEGLVEKLRDANIAWDGGYYINYTTGYDEAAALLTTYGDKIRRECGDRGVEWLHPKRAIYNCSLDNAMKRNEA